MKSKKIITVWLWIMWSLSPVAQAQMPTIGAGMIEVLDKTPTVEMGSRTFFWTPSAVYRHLEGSETTEEMTSVDSSCNSQPLWNVRGMLASPDANLGGLNPAHSDVWVWTDYGVFHRQVVLPCGPLTAGEITTGPPPAATNPIPNVDGMISAPNEMLNHPSGTDVFMWNDAGIFVHLVGSTYAAEMVDPSGFGIPKVRGVVSTPDANPTNPYGTNIWIYNDTSLHIRTVLSAPLVQTTEITTGPPPATNPLAGLRGVLGVPNAVNAAGTDVYVWNGAGVYRHVYGSTYATELTYAGGLPLQDVRGMISFTNIGGYGILMWNPSGVFLYLLGTPEALEMSGPLGPLAGVRGIVSCPDVLSPFDETLWIYNGAGVFFWNGGGTTAAEIFLPPAGGTSPITNVRGIVHGTDFTGFNPSETNVFIYNDSGVFLHQQAFSLNAVEITTGPPPATNPISGVRGIMSAYDQDPLNPTRSSTWIWNGASVFHHIVGTTYAQEIVDDGSGPTDPNFCNDPPVYTQFPIQNVWGQINSQDDTVFSVSGRTVWIRNAGRVLRHVEPTTCVSEIFDPNGNSIGSPTYTDPAVGLAVVHNVGSEGGGQGAGLDQDSPPFVVDYVGHAAGAAVEVTPVLPSATPGLTVAIAGRDAQFVHSPGGTSLSNDHVAVLMTLPEPSPIGGACCDTLGMCTLETAQTCGGLYKGDGSICLGDLNGDGFDDTCVPIPTEPEYQEDDGHGEFNIGIQHLGGSGDIHTMAWLNAFPLDCTTGTTVTKVKIAFGNLTPTFPPPTVDVYVWEDPNADGDPDDAVVVSWLLGAPVTSSNSNTFVEFDVPDVLITTGYFFAGAVMEHGHTETPARLDTNGTSTPTQFFDPNDFGSWMAGRVNGVPINPNVLADPAYDLELVDTYSYSLTSNPPVPSGNWMIRAVTAQKGACCLPGGQCIDNVSECDCVNQLNGFYQGPGTDCFSNPCPDCGPGAGSCTLPNGTPGCDDVTCCTNVCAVDPLCCSNQWDSSCVAAAQGICYAPTCPPDFDWEVIDAGAPGVPPTCQPGDTTIPGTARHGFAMGYHAASGQTVIVGGLDSGGNLVPDTILWDGANWTTISGVAPSFRSSAMAYDSDRQKLVLMGGVAGGGILNADIWEFDGSGWTVVGPGINSPVPRLDLGLAYDSDRKVMVMTGGNAGDPATHEYDPATQTWTVADPVNPGPLLNPNLIYDPVQEVTVLYALEWVGGIPVSVTKTWDGVSWTTVATGGPTPRWFAAMDYDSVRQVVVLSGGQDPSTGTTHDDMWEWDSVSWTQVTPANLPPARMLHGMAYHAQRNQMVLIGGWPASGGGGFDCASYLWAYPGQNVVATYQIVGSGNGTDWSWSLDDGANWDVGDQNTTGMSGTSTDMAGYFADQINAVGCDSLRAAVLPGTGDSFTVIAGGSQTYDLCVGAAGAAPGCCIQYGDLCTTTPCSGCSFNPDVLGVQLSYADCNANGMDDVIDILNDDSPDDNFNGIPDECEPPWPDFCQSNLDCDDGDPCTTDLCNAELCDFSARLFGDANNDGVRNIVDVICSARVIFQDATVCGAQQVALDEIDIAPSAECGDGQLNIVDVVIHARAVFQDAADECCTE